MTEKTIDRMIVDEADGTAKNDWRSLESDGKSWVAH